MRALERRVSWFVLPEYVCENLGEHHQLLLPLLLGHHLSTVFHNKLKIQCPTQSLTIPRRTFITRGLRMSVEWRSARMRRSRQLDMFRLLHSISSHFLLRCLRTYYKSRAGSRHNSSLLLPGQKQPEACHSSPLSSRCFLRIYRPACQRRSHCRYLQVETTARLTINCSLPLPSILIIPVAFSFMSCTKAALKNGDLAPRIAL